MYSRSVTPTPSCEDQDEAKTNQDVVGSLTNIDPNYPGASVKFFNYNSDIQSVKSLGQEMLDAESVENESENIYDESSKLLGDDNKESFIK